MTRRLLIFSFAAAMMTLAPATVTAAEADMPAIEQSVEDEIGIAINGQTVTIVGAQGQTLEVVSLTGRRVMALKVESPAQRFELNVPKGCYILKVGKVVRKVSVH